MAIPVRVALLLAGAFASSATTIACKKKPPPPPAHTEKEDEDEDEEEREQKQEHLWRVALTLEGHGFVKTNIQGLPEISLHCVRNEKGQSGECGPKLVKFKERQPALITAHGAKGWKFVRWESKTKKADGLIVPTPKKIEPGLRVYINGMGIEDKGELELLTAHFEKQADPEFEDKDATPTPAQSEDPPYVPAAPGTKKKK